MSRNDNQRIADILDACDELAVIIELKSQGTTPAVVLVRAAERLLEIIGEAAGNVTAAETDLHPEVDWRELSRLRIFLAHHYHRTDASLIWEYASSQAPALAAALRR